jgi:PAS domain-containing protein
LDRDWRLVYINASTERMIGRSRGELLGTTFWEEFPDTIGTTLEREFRRALAEKTSVEFHDYFEPADRWYQILACPCQDGIPDKRYVRPVRGCHLHPPKTGRMERRKRMHGPDEYEGTGSGCLSFERRSSEWVARSVSTRKWERAVNSGCNYRREK